MIWLWNKNLVNPLYSVYYRSSSNKNIHKNGIEIFNEYLENVVNFNKTNYG